MKKKIFTICKNLSRWMMNFILDALFPRRCIGCGAFDIWLCTSCHSILPLLSEQQCPLCKHATTPNGEVCHACTTKHRPSLCGILIASNYDNDLLKRVIYTFKYRFVSDCGEPLALLLAQSLMHSTLSVPDIIISVPLHKRRLRWRGFNQATILAQNLDLQIPLDTTTLARTRHTQTQVHLRSKKRRKQNLTNAFSIRDTSAIIGKKILLIDDVTTTGTTLTECANVLTRAGAHSVHALVLARE